MWGKRDDPGYLARISVLERAMDELERRGVEAPTRQEIVALAARQDVFENQLDLFEERLTQTRHAVAEGIERVERTENRIKATIQRAKKELADGGHESPGLDAEARELRLVDGAGGEERGVPALPEEVAEFAGEASSVPGVTVEELQRARGM